MALLCKYLISHRVAYCMKCTECAVRIKYCQDNEQGWGFLALSLKAMFRVNRTVEVAEEQKVEGLPSNHARQLSLVYETRRSRAGVVGSESCVREVRQKALPRAFQCITCCNQLELKISVAKSGLTQNHS